MEMGEWGKQKLWKDVGRNEQKAGGRIAAEKERGRKRGPGL